MRQREELLEQYEDALFALLLDRVVQAEGNWAFRENARLKEDPGAAVPETLQRRCRDMIQRGFAPEQQKRKPRIPWKFLHHAAVIVLLLAATVTVAVAAFPNLRADFLNTILNVYDTHTDFSFEEDIPIPPELQIEVGWLPEGFELLEDDGTRLCSWKYYENEARASVEINKSKPTKITVDTEDAKVTQIPMQGYGATQVEKNGEVTILWLDTNRQVVFFVNTEGIGVETTLKIAENVS